MPLGLELDVAERAVLDALGRAPELGLGEIGRIARAENPLAWITSLIAKLSELGLDLVAPGPARNGEPTYLLRR
jgi:hypothetical protein